MKTDDVLAIVKERGLRIEITPDGPVLRGNAAEATPALLRVLRLHRDEIVRRLTPEPEPKAEPVEITEPVTEAAVNAPEPDDPCPQCQRPLDRGRCWGLKCGWRRCIACGRNTGSVFIASCVVCQATGRID